MIDMLVRLYDLPESAELYRNVEAQGVTLRRPNGYEKHIVADWVGRLFSPKWKAEAEVAFSRRPVSCFIATRDKRIQGFACYETTLKNYFGPTGVAEEARGSGLGKALLFKALEALRAEGYAYAVIGGVGPREFYEKACGAFEIPGATREFSETSFRIPPRHERFLVCESRIRDAGIDIFRTDSWPINPLAGRTPIS